MNGSIVVTGTARGIGRAISDRLATNPSFEVIGVDMAPELALAENLTPV
jgi:NAD(P)-dependent dehydrogenase (short-subunit alcohol dehydrogenase family)